MSNPTPESPKEAQKVFKIHRWQIGLNVLIQLAVVFAIIVLVNYLGFRHFKRWDFSHDQQYALSSQTKNVLSNLQKPVRAVIYFSSAAELLPDLNNLLREYQFASDKKFTVEAVDPYKNLTRAKELADKYKIQANDNIVILDYDGKSKFVNASDMADFETPDQMQMMAGAQARMKDFKGEAAITGALLELTAGKPNKVYLVTGHGEPDLTGQGFRVFNDLLKRQNIQTAPLKLLDAGKVPDDARSLLIYGPKYDLSELEIKLINEFWQKKGSLFVCLNPYAKTARLNAWLSDQGVTPQEDRVIGVANTMTMDENTGLPKFSKGLVTDAAFTIVDNGGPITKDLGGVAKQLLGSTQSLQLDQQRAQMLHIRLTPLMQGLASFWGETDLTGDLKNAYFDPKKDHPAPVTIGASVEKGAIEDVRVKSVETARMIIVGNAELLSDQEGRLTEGATEDFVINALNWALAHEEAIGIPPKEKKTVTINLDEKQLMGIVWITMYCIPFFFAAIGLIVWAVRGGNKWIAFPLLFFIVIVIPLLSYLVTRQH